MSNDAAKDSSFLPVCGFTLSKDQEMRRVLLPSLLHFSEAAPKHASKPLVMSQRELKAKTEAVNEMVVYRRSTELDFFFSVVVVVDD